MKKRQGRNKRLRHEERDWNELNNVELNKTEFFECMKIAKGARSAI